MYFVNEHHKYMLPNIKDTRAMLYRAMYFEKEVHIC